MAVPEAGSIFCESSSLTMASLQLPASASLMPSLKEDSARAMSWAEAGGVCASAGAAESTRRRVESARVRVQWFIAVLGSWSEAGDQEVQAVGGQRACSDVDGARD